MPSRPTIKDVAARAGVSRQTVSRVINHKDDVRDATRERVLAAIDELGYRPSAVARSMVAGSTRMLGCIAPNLIDYTFASMIEGAQAEARRLGYFVLTGSAPSEPDVESLVEEMLHRRVDGFLVLNPRNDGRYGHFLRLVERGIPVVYMKNTPDGAPVSSVCCDDVEGGIRATQHLIALGHTAIATILGPTNEECTADRLAGYRQALAEAGLHYEPALVGQGDWTPTSGQLAVQRMLSAGLAFSALFVHNDKMALGAVRALHRAGRRVPGDVSVIGYDDIPLAPFFDPPLTTMRQPMQQFGQRAARAAIEAVRDPGCPPEQIWLHAELIERASCASVRA